MNKLYRRLALNSLSKNKVIYIPYIIASVSMYVLFYMIAALAMDKYLSKVPGGAAVQQILAIGIFVIIQVVLIFLMDIRSMVVKQRKKELGMYSILGMEKRHVMRVNALENIYVYLLTAVIGSTIGTVLEKFFQVMILRVIDAEQDFSWEIPIIPLIISVLFFAFVYALIITVNSVSIKKANVIEYMKEQNSGEKQPKANWFGAVIGTILVALGYVMSIRIDSAVDALTAFFIAVSLVIFGTMFLFRAGSITVLNCLRKNKKYYYQTSHFISVSGMLYRMKRNADSLTTICIVSTMFLVTMSSVTCLYSSISDTVDNWYCYDLAFKLYNVPEEEGFACVNEMAEKYGVEFDSCTRFKMLEAFTDITLPEENASTIEFNINETYISNAYDTYYFTQDRYQELAGENIGLSENEIAVYSDKGISSSVNKITPQGSDALYDIKILDESPRIPHSSAITVSNGMACVIFSSEEVMYDFFNFDSESAFADVYSNEYENAYYVCSSNSNPRNQVDLVTAFKSDERCCDCCGRYEARENITSLYSGLFFLGIFLSVGFLIITVLTMYFRQLFEGYEDVAGFAIMRKVGLSKNEIKKSINSQIVMVFFLPLVIAIIHTIFAFPMLRRILRIFGNITASKFLIVLACVVLVFTVVYTISYLCTSNVYSKLVNGAYSERKSF